jgi:hypothetical protein
MDNKDVNAIAKEYIPRTLSPKNLAMVILNSIIKNNVIIFIRINDPVFLAIICTVFIFILFKDTIDSFFEYIFTKTGYSKLYKCH